MGPVLGFDLDYLGQLTIDEATDLLRLAGLLRQILQSADISVADAKKRSGWTRLGSLLAVTEARRPTLAQLERFAVALDAPPDSIPLIVAACPAAVAPER